MDEPFAGNDLFNREDFYKVLVGILEPQETLLLSTHLLEETAPLPEPGPPAPAGNLSGRPGPPGAGGNGCRPPLLCEACLSLPTDRVSRALTQLTNGKEPLP